MVPADALEAVRVSSLKSLRALQTLARVSAQICADITRHRWTLPTPVQIAADDESYLCSLPVAVRMRPVHMDCFHRPAVSDTCAELTVKPWRCRLTLGLRMSRTWAALKARCRALLRVPLLWCAASLGNLFGSGGSSSAGGLHAAGSGGEGGQLLPGGLSSASVAAQAGSGIVHDLAEADDITSTAESGPALGRPVHDAALWDDVDHVKYE